MIQYIEENKYGYSGKMQFVLFNKEIEVALDGGTIDYAEKCAKYLNELSENVIQDLCAASIRYCHAIQKVNGTAPQIFQSPKDVLRHINPSLLIVPELVDITELIIHLELNCTWEVEHGMEWIIRNDKLLYVGAFNGENPLGDFTKKGDWNFA
jgi:hypothetical protein